MKSVVKWKKIRKEKSTVGYTWNGYTIQRDWKDANHWIFLPQPDGWKVVNAKGVTVHRCRYLVDAKIRVALLEEVRML